MRIYLVQPGYSSEECYLRFTTAQKSFFLNFISVAVLFEYIFPILIKFSAMFT